MPGRLEGRVAIVTGAASGFGKAIATTFRREGANVVITDLSEDTGNAVAKEIGATFARADVTKREDWEKVLQQAIDSFGRLDIVINNAGTTYANKVCIALSLFILMNPANKRSLAYRECYRSRFRFGIQRQRQVNLPFDERDTTIFHQERHPRFFHKYCIHCWYPASSRSCMVQCIESCSHQCDKDDGCRVWPKRNSI